MNTLDAARASDDVDGHTLTHLERADGVLTLDGTDMFLCEAERRRSDLAVLHPGGVWATYGSDDTRKAMEDLATRMNVDPETASVHLSMIRSIIASGGGPEELALLLDLEDMTGIWVDCDILTRMFDCYGRGLLRDIFDERWEKEFPRAGVIDGFIRLYAARAWREGRNSQILRAV